MKLKNCKFRIVDDTSQLAFFFMELIFLGEKNTTGLNAYTEPAIFVKKKKKGFIRYNVNFTKHHTFCIFLSAKIQWHYFLSKNTVASAGGCCRSLCERIGWI